MRTFSLDVPSAHEHTCQRQMGTFTYPTLLVDADFRDAKLVCRLPNATTKRVRQRKSARFGFKSLCSTNRFTWSTNTHREARFGCCLRTISSSIGWKSHARWKKRKDKPWADWILDNQANPNSCRSWNLTQNQTQRRYKGGIRFGCRLHCYSDYVLDIQDYNTISVHPDTQYGEHQSQGYKLCANLASYESLTRLTNAQVHCFLRQAAGISAIHEHGTALRLSAVIWLCDTVPKGGRQCDHLLLHRPCTDLVWCDSQNGGVIMVRHSTWNLGQPVAVVEVDFQSDLAMQARSGAQTDSHSPLVRSCSTCAPCFQASICLHWPSQPCVFPGSFTHNHPELWTGRMHYLLAL